ncbi:MAG TPA: FG-GAP-like repeat-containing protein [Nitrospirota bacterium]|nr:FG-GAP-like repeat-containing protein [Nitrospirota bacterium]
MRKLIITVMLACSAAAFAYATDKPLGVEEFTTVDDLVGAIAAYFPKVQGEVNTVQGEKVTISLGRKDGVAPGMTLTLWRVAKEILHPVTNAVIGRTEEEVGAVEVSKVSEKESTATVIKKQKEPRAGDKARITPRKISLAVVPLRTTAPEVAAELTQRLAESGRFTVLEADKTAAFLKDRKTADASLVAEMHRSFGLDVVVTLSIYPTEGKLLVITKILYAEDGRLIDTITATLVGKQKTELAETVKPFFEPVQEEQTTSPDLPFRARFFARADLDGDGIVEHVFSDGMRLHIYRLEASGWKEVWTESLRGVNVLDIQHISLDTADINGNGRPEVFVTAMVGDRVVSSVTEWQEGAYRKIAELPDLLRVVHYPGRKPQLIGLAYDAATFYTGKPKEYAWSGNGYTAGAVFPLPAGVRLYGFTFADFGDSRIYLVSLNDEDRLVVYSGDTPVWKSEEEYPGGDTVVLRPLTQTEKMTTGPASDPSNVTKERQLRIKGRILAVDLDGDRRQEILLPKNSRPLLFVDFSKKTDLRALRWTGARLDDRWSVRDIAGSILDLQADSEGQVARVRVLVRSSGGLFSKDAERVILYTMKEERGGAPADAGKKQQ